MSSPSNLYAEKVFSEHPMALWALDDKLDYVSLISEAQRNMLALWEETGCTFSAGTGLTGEPFPDSYTTKVSCDIPVGVTSSSPKTSLQSVDAPSPLPSLIKRLIGVFSTMGKRLIGVFSTIGKLDICLNLTISSNNCAFI